MCRATAVLDYSVGQFSPMRPPKAALSFLQNPSEFPPFLVMNPRDRRSPLTMPIALGVGECFANKRISHIMKLTTAHNVLGKLTTAHNVPGKSI
ncbi:hypothetical protein RHA1_ro00691 [Rhodococcus jostii RHA1]|uniref:Uncharacterized protein n=1 Tax=Rhodococcus jostii (strain RHA1) TaxID=101510 RepID=Q0SIW0_RHOJR|nr:hypothetical protein RHA1_ro00691 [Rhodococcus jostii RHA1]